MLHVGSEQLRGKQMECMSETDWWKAFCMRSSQISMIKYNNDNNNNNIKDPILKLWSNPKWCLWNLFMWNRCCWKPGDTWLAEVSWWSDVARASSVTQSWAGLPKLPKLSLLIYCLLTWLLILAFCSPSQMIPLKKKEKKKETSASGNLIKTEIVASVFTNHKQQFFS